MLIYLLIFVVITTIGCKYVSATYTANFKTTIFLYILVVLSWGMTYINAPDIPEYIYYFKRFVFDWTEDGYGINAFNNFEPGFLWLSSMARTISHEFYIFQLILFLIELSFIMIGLDKLFGPNKMIAFVCVLFFVLPFNLLGALRQGIAISIFIFSLQFIVDKKLVMYCLCMGFASLFHTSAILLILLYWIPDFVSFIRYKWAAASLLLFLNICYFAGFSISSFLEPVVYSLAGSSDGLDIYTSRYADSIESAEQSNFGVLKILEMNFVYFLFLIMNRDEERVIKTFKSLFLFYFVLNFLLGGIVAHRISYYFVLIYYICFAISAIWFAGKYLKSKSLGYGLLCTYLAFLYLFVFNTEGGSSSDHLKNMFIEDVINHTPIV